MAKRCAERGRIGPLRTPLVVELPFTFSRGGVAKIKGTGKTRRKGAHDGLTSFSVHRNLVPPFTILSMTCQFMNPQH